MVESNIHKTLKKDVADILVKMGYTVQTGGTLTGPRGGSMNIDIIGEKAGERVALEIGKLGARKFDQLTRNYGFEQVIHVPDRDNIGTAIASLGTELSLIHADGDKFEAIVEAGVVTLDPFWDRTTDTISEKRGTERLKALQLLRDKFAPVSSGVELYISYSVGNGYDLRCFCEDFEANGECEHIDYIEEFAITHNLDKHLQGIADRTLTHGFCLVEVVYEKSDQYTFESFEVGSDPPMEDLGTIVQLKIIDSLLHEIEAERKETYDIQYYALDKETDNEIRLHPWEAVNFTWNVREPKWFGESLIEPTEPYAEWLVNMQKSYAKGIFRQGNPIPIFIAKNWGKKQLKNLRNLIKAREGSGGMGALVFGGDVEVKLLGVEGEMLSRKEAFDHYIDMIAVAMSVPSFFYNVDASNRAETSEKQVELFQTRVGRFSRAIKRAVEHGYFTWLIRQKFGDEAPVPSITWNVSYTQNDSEIQKLRQLLTVRYLSPEIREAAERRIGQLMNLKLPEELTIIHPGTDPLKKSDNGDNGEGDNGEAG